MSSSSSSSGRQRRETRPACSRGPPASGGLPVLSPPPQILIACLYGRPPSPSPITPVRVTSKRLDLFFPCLGFPCRILVLCEQCLISSRPWSHEYQLTDPALLVSHLSRFPQPCGALRLIRPPGYFFIHARGSLPDSTVYILFYRRLGVYVWTESLRRKLASPTPTLIHTPPRP